MDVQKRINKQEKIDIYLRYLIYLICTCFPQISNVTPSVRTTTLDKP